MVTHITKTKTHISNFLQVLVSLIGMFIAKLNLRSFPSQTTAEQIQQMLLSREKLLSGSELYKPQGVIDTGNNRCFQNWSQSGK
jgi:hypothetical protein